MIYKMDLKDSSDTMTFNLLETPIVDKDIEGAVDNITLDGNQYTDYLYLKKQYIQKWAIMCPDEYDELRGFYTRQFEDGEVPSYRVYYGANVTRDYTLNGDYFQFNAEGIETGMTLSQLLGNAEQTTYSGKNLLPSINTTRTRNGVTFTHNDDGSISLSGTATADTAYPINVNSTGNARNVPLSAGNYIVSGGSATSPTTVYMQAYYGTIGGADRYSASTFTLEADGTIGAYIYVKSGVNTSGKTIYPMVEAGSTPTSYEQFVGGIPAPNPSYPQPISTATGEQTIKVVGKNLLGGYTYTYSVSGATATYNEDGTLSMTGTCTSLSWSSGTAFVYQRNLMVKLKAGTYTFTVIGDSDTQLVSIDLDGTGERAEATIDGGNDSRTFTISTEKLVYARIKVPAGATGYTIKFMLEESASATAYEPYQGQSYTIDLDTLELARIGNYQDRIYKDDGKWYIEKQVGKVVLDGSEAGWSRSTYGGSYCAFWTTNSQVIPNLDTTKKTKMSDYFTYRNIAWNNGAVITPILCENSTDAGNMLIFSGYANTMTLTDWQTWLATHNTTVYYPLATQTTTEITDETLLYQLNFLASLYEGENNISLVGAGVQGEMEVFIRDVMSVETDVVPEVPVRLTLTDDGVINACGCRRNVQLTMRETTE